MSNRKTDWPHVVHVVIQDILVVGLLAFCVYACSGGLK